MPDVVVVYNVIYTPPLLHDDLSPYFSCLFSASFRVVIRLAPHSKGLSRYARLRGKKALNLFLQLAPTPNKIRIHITHMGSLFRIGALINQLFACLP